MGLTLLIAATVLAFSACDGQPTDRGAASESTARPGVTAGVPSPGVAANAPASASTPAVASNAGDLPTPTDILLAGLLRSLSDEELVGQLFMVSLEQNDDGTPVTRLSPQGRETLAAVRPGGFILFAGNIGNEEQVRAFVDQLQDTSRIPLFVATDHEGGNVSRLTASPDMNATVMPSQTLVGIAADVLVARGEMDEALRLANDWGRVVGEELRALGVTMNMAPVADVDAGAGESLLAVQRRTFGSNPELVGGLAAAAMTGMQDAGVTAVLKHFPGQGAASEDSHTGLIELGHDRDRLDVVDLVPFRAALEAGARAVMSAHIAFPAVTGTADPATVSPELLTDLLRGELAFNGLVITDALNMDAVAGGAGAELAMRSIVAGADVLLKPLAPEEVHAALVRVMKSGIVSRGRVVDSVRRILLAKLTAGLFGPAPAWSNPDAAEVLGSEEHAAVVAEIRAVARSRRE